MLKIIDLHNGMILSILSINSHCFAFGLLEMPHTDGDSVSYL